MKNKRKKSRLAIVSMLLLITGTALSCLSISYAAYINKEKQEQTINISMDFSSLFGTEGSNTYTITDSDQLRNLSRITYMGYSTPEMTFKLINDIDYSGEALLPIGSDDTPFYSIFDGNGYTISNLNVIGCDLGDIGMFGYVANSGSIKNFLLKNPTVTATSKNGSFSYSYEKINGNPFRSAFTESEIESISINISDTTKTTYDSSIDASFKSFSFSYDSITSKGYTPKIYISNSDVVTDDGSGIYQINSSSSSDSCYFTVEIYIEGITKDNDTDQYYYSRYTLERFKIYFYSEDNEKYFVADPNDKRYYRKTIMTDNSYAVVGTERHYYYNKHVIYAGIVCGHLDGDASYIGVSGPTLKGELRPFRSNSYLIGKKLDDDDISSLSKESIDFANAFPNDSDTVSFTQVPNSSGAIDGQSKNRYINNVYGNDKFSQESLSADYLKIYGKSGLSSNYFLYEDANEDVKLVKHSYNTGNTDDNGEAVIKSGNFLSFKNAMDCYTTTSTWQNANVYNLFDPQSNNAQSVMAKNCIMMWITQDTSGNFWTVLQKLLSQNGYFYINFSFDYLLYDSNQDSSKTTGDSNIKFKVLSTSKRSDRPTRDGFFATYNLYDYYYQYDGSAYQRYNNNGSVTSYSLHRVRSQSEDTNNSPGYVDETFDSNPLGFSYSNVLPYSSYSDDSLRGKIQNKNITIVSNPTLFRWDLSVRGRTPIFYFGIDGDSLKDGQQFALDILNFTVTLSTLNGNLSSDPLTVDYTTANVSASYSRNDGTWSNWPIYSNTKVSASCFSKEVNGTTGDDGTITYGDIKFQPINPGSGDSAYIINASRSNDNLNTQNTVTITYSNCPDDNAKPVNETGYIPASIQAA